MKFKYFSLFKTFMSYWSAAGSLDIRLLNHSWAFTYCTKCSELNQIFPSGVIKNFAQQDVTYEKWVLNRPFRAKVFQPLLSLAPFGNTLTNPRSCLRERRIKKSEEHVCRIVIVLKNTFMNPFNEDLDKDKLFNLASGQALPNEITEGLLSV